MEIHRLIVMAVAALAAGCALNTERDIALAEVPPVVLSAAQAAVEGFTIEAAELETENGETVYELEGIAGGVAYEIEVSPDGRVLEVETEEE